VLLESFDVSFKVNYSLFDGLNISLESLGLSCSSLFNDSDFVTALCNILIESSNVRSILLLELLVLNLHNFQFVFVLLRQFPEPLSETVSLLLVHVNRVLFIIERPLLKLVQLILEYSLFDEK
jgi:hypothetical protein